MAVAQVVYVRAGCGEFIYPPPSVVGQAKTLYEQLSVRKGTTETVKPFRRAVTDCIYGQAMESDDARCLYVMLVVSKSLVTTTARSSTVFCYLHYYQTH